MYDRDNNTLEGKQEASLLFKEKKSKIQVKANGIKTHFLIFFFPG